jgi:hypothetical protein
MYRLTLRSGSITAGAVSEIHHVGAVAQTLVNERYDVHFSSFLQSGGGDNAGAAVSAATA